MTTAPSYSRSSKPLTERAAFLAGLANLSGPPYIAGDLANLVGVTPKDALDLTAHLARRWEHPDESKPFWNYSDVERWLRKCCHGNHAAEVEIVLEREGNAERLAGVFYGEARS